MDLQNALDFTDRRVLVCGGSDGIGYGIARAFVAAGAHVTVTGTRTADAYTQDFSQVDYARLDVKDAAAVEKLAARFARLDVLVNSIGSVLFKKGEFELDGFETIVDINLTGAMRLSVAFFPLLQASQGCIIHLDSVAALRPTINNPAYSASKAGLMHLSKSLAMKWGPTGVRVNSIAPGLVPSKLTANQTGPEAEAAFAKRNPIPRLGTVEDIAGGAMFLASPLAAYITGHQLVIDGGTSL